MDIFQPASVPLFYTRLAEKVKPEIGLTPPQTRPPRAQPRRRGGVLVVAGIICAKLIHYGA